MSVDVVEDLVRVYRGSIPGDITSSDIGLDVAYSLAAIMAMVEAEIARLDRGSKASTSVGAFTDAHLADHGLRRQSGETDDQAIIRMSRPPQAGTTLAIIESVQLIVGDAGDVFVIELPRDSAYFDRQNFYFDLGYRFGGGRGVVIVLIPQSANALSSVADAVRSKVSAGKIWRVEEYT